MAVQFKDAVGWSKFESYATCPQRFKYVFMEKRKEPESQALTHGSDVHKSLELWLNGWGTGEPMVLPSWMPRLRELKAKQPITEAAWGIDNKWRPLDNWLDPHCWLRAKSDVFYFEVAKKTKTMVLIDFKSGKYRIPSDEQNELYGIVGHAMHTDVTHVRTSFWFVEQESVPHETVYSAKELIGMRGKFEKRAKRIFADRRFKPTPGAHCRYCFFSRQKGGPCQY